MKMKATITIEYAPTEKDYQKELTPIDEASRYDRWLLGGDIHNGILLGWIRGQKITHSINITLERTE